MAVRPENAVATISAVSPPNRGLHQVGGKCRRRIASVTSFRVSDALIMANPEFVLTTYRFNVVRPGGVLAATRCVDGEENGDQGNDFKVRSLFVYQIMFLISISPVDSFSSTPKGSSPSNTH
jgi:hypothetical protein